MNNQDPFAIDTDAVLKHLGLSTAPVLTIADEGLNLLFPAETGSDGSLGVSLAMSELPTSSETPLNETETTGETDTEIASEYNF